ncbi:diguanylate cyclase domain-containing protein [Psychromonas antarctica]|uniref:diguanylate cyclase domain-containing protein n=1 Tax=Psychromonas antarctica TaxID=67573 RepID=UPI001EE7F479|nr:diguanylate cyclase [Psychromonas antarctica]MCG6200062.1 diguanylate cyclase [Psychromonas antarctica]
MRLRTQYSIAMVLLIGIAVTFMSAILFYQFSKNARVQQTVSTEAISDAIILQIMKRGEFMTNSFSRYLVDDIYYENQAKITQALQSSLTQQDLLFIEIFDPKGYIINDGSVELWAFGNQVNDPQMLNAIRKSDNIYTRIEADKVIFARSIKIDDEVIAGIHLGFSLLYIQKDISKMEKTLQKELTELSERDFQKNIFIVIVASLLLLIVGIIMAIFTANKLTQPIHQLALHARKAGKGDHLNRIELNRSDELGQLAAIFNKMNRRLLKNKKEIHYQAFHDHLTGLANRNMFNKYINETLQQAANQKKQVTVLFLDLDGFKAINDTFGHEVGDKLLIVIAERFNAVIRKQDSIKFAELPNNMLVSRIGGDEFTIVLQDIGEKQIVSQIASRIIRSIASPIELSGEQLNIGVSIGISI